MIAIPRSLASLAYLSYPFGIPVGLPPRQLLDSRRTTPQQVYDLLAQHTELPLAQFFEDPQQKEFYQARLLLKSPYFTSNTGQIKMHMFMWSSPKELADLRLHLTAIAAQIPEPKLKLQIKNL